MEFYAVLPLLKFSNESIGIRDGNNANIGYVKRNFKSKVEKFLHMILPFLETRNLIGEVNGKYFEFSEHSFKANLFRLKWDVHFSEKNNDNQNDCFLLEDKTKISTNPCFLFSKNGANYLFKKEFLSRSCYIFNQNNNKKCAEIKVEKLLPASLKITVHSDELTVVEILGIFYILNLTY